MYGYLEDGFDAAKAVQAGLQPSGCAIAGLAAIDCDRERVDNQLLASGSADNTIRVWHLATGKLMDILTGHSEPVRSVAFSPNDQILASGGEDRTIKIWGLGTGD